MKHAGSEFEIKNSQGSNDFFDETTDPTPGTVSTYPATADKIIEKFVLENRAPIVDERTPLVNIDTIIEFSIDGGTKYDSIFAGQGVEVEPKSVQQIKIRSNAADAPFRLTLAFEKFDEES